MIKLYNYWRSGTSHRVRIALALKGVDYDYEPLNLLAGEHRGAAYKAINPQGLAPAVAVDGRALVQSPAILEWIEESWPEPPLLPRDRFERARVRAMAALVACDIHPLNNLRVLKALKADFGASQAQVLDWIGRWTCAGFAALESMLEDDSGPGDGAGRGDFCFGGAPSLAECCLIPQVYAARRFEVDLAPFPLIVAIDAACAGLPAFVAAAPQNQPDAA